MHEIIHIVDPEFGQGQVRHGLEIEAVNDRPLAAGYYFVLWPVAQRAARNQEKRYFGPFRTGAEARMLQRSAMALGLVQDGVVTAHEITECRSIVRPAVSVSHPPAHRVYMPPRRELAACAG
jgi:hypothetical protein